MVQSNPAIDPRELRSALGSFVTGVTVVTTLDQEGAPRGFTANSFTSVSLDPPLILVCVGRHTNSYQAFASTECLAVNILAEMQQEVSRAFASSGGEKFANVRWRGVATGSPVLNSTAAWLDCVVHQRVEAGDHMVLIGRVVDFGRASISPLAFCRGNYVSFRLEQDALAASTANRIRVGALLEYKQQLLLVRHDGQLNPPVGRSLGRDETENGSLTQVLQTLGIQAEINFLFAVFEDSNADVLNVYYRGTVTDVSQMDPTQVELTPLQEVMSASFLDDAVREMVGRYVAERLENQFGIYVGDMERGTVRQLSGKT